MEKLFGWAGKILRLDLSNGEKEHISTDKLSELYIGGRGFSTRFYWDEVKPETDALAPENPLMIMAGPLTGTSAPACSRLFISGKSPLFYPDQFGTSSIGSFIPYKLKSAGLDGLIINGKAKRPCCIIIQDEQIDIIDAGSLWGLDVTETMGKISTEYGKDAEALCIGPAGEKLCRYAVGCTKNGSTFGHGFGAVMGSKNLKAIIVKGSKRINTAYPDRLKMISREIRSMIKGRMLMDPMIPDLDLRRRTPCYACPAGCPRGIYKHSSGKIESRKNCASAYLYADFDKLYHGEVSPHSFHATSLCNRMGICTQETGKVLSWIDKCFKNGILTDENTGLPLSKMGSPEFFKAFIEKILSRDGFGDILAEGTIRAAKEIGNEAEKMLEGIVEKAGFNAEAYNPRYFITNAVFRAMDSANPMAYLHEICYPLFKWVLWNTTDGSISSVTTESLIKLSERFWGGKTAADFSTYEGKANAAAIIQNRVFAKETLVACDFFYPIMTPEGTEEHVGDPTIENRLLSAVTGVDYSLKDYYRTGERIFNLTRAIQAREGHQGKKDDIIPEFNFTEGIEEDKIYFGIFNPDFMLPGPEGKLITRKGERIDRDKFNKMMEEHYQIRGWDKKTGLQTRKILKELSLSDIIPEMEERKLL